MDKKGVDWKIFYNVNMSARKKENVKNGIFNYTGHIGGAHYFYIKPGTYTIKSLSATNGNYIYLEYGNVKIGRAHV